MTPQSPNNRVLDALTRRLDRAALDQLRTAAAEQAALIDYLQQRVADLEDCAESWREDALDAMTELAKLRGHELALVPSGQLITVPAAQVSA